MSTSSTSDWLRGGIVGRPHGLDGSFYVGDANAVLLAVGAKVMVGGVSRSIVRKAGTAERPILRLDGCEDRSGAEALRGELLLVPREAAPELEDDEWWVEDLEGCEVHADSGPVGTVRRVLPLPSCEVLEVSRDQEDDLLVPLIADAVLDVDLASRTITVDLHFLGVH